MSHFATGNAGGPGGARAGAGRKPGGARAAARRIFGGVTEDDWGAIVAKAVEQAKNGDATARAWLSDRAFGRTVTTDALHAEQELREEFEACKESISALLESTDPALKDALHARLQKTDDEDE